MKQTLQLFFIFLLVQSGFSQSGVDFSGFETHVQKGIDNKTIPSVVVAVAKDGQIIYEKAFGYADVENRIQATTAIPYQLASVSKPITATAIMLLDQKKVIDVHAPAENYISPLQFKSYEGKSSDVKTMDLLNHTSGLGTYFQISYADENRQVDDFENAFKKYGILVHPAGRICEYSNLGYGLLDYIIEKQSGKSFSAYLKEELFKPLGMKNTFVDAPNDSNTVIAQKYGPNQSRLPELTNNTKGAGNIYASAHDLILFGMSHLKNSKNTLLKKETLDLMQGYINKETLYHYYDETTYGLGWYFKTDAKGTKIVWHEGGMMGASTMLKLIPEENIAIAVLINTSNQQYCQDITNHLSKIVLPKYTPEPINEVAEYNHFTSDSTFFGEWKGFIKVGELDIPCTLKMKENGDVLMDYVDFTYKSYFTQDNPIPNKTFLLTGLVNKNAFIGMFPGNLPSADLRNEFSQFMSLKLYKKDTVLSGTLVAMAAADRQYYAYPYYIRLEKQ